MPLSCDLQNVVTRYLGSSSTIGRSNQADFAGASFGVVEVLGHAVQRDFVCGGNFPLFLGGGTGSAGFSRRLLLSQPGNQTSADSAKDCSVNSDAPREAEQAADREQRPSQAQSDPVGESETADAAPAAVNLEQDLKILEQRQSGLAQCILAANVQEPGTGFARSMFRRAALEFRDEARRRAGAGYPDWPAVRQLGLFL